MPQAAVPALNGLTRLSAYWLAILGGVVVIDAAAVIAGEYRWWANFILVAGGILMVPAAPPSRLRQPLWNVMLWAGVIVTLVGTLLTFNAMRWGWPLLVSVPCLGLAVTALRARAQLVDASARAVTLSVVELAGLGTLLGLTLMLIIHDVIDLSQYRWWAGYMIMAGLAPTSNGLLLLARRRGFEWFSVAVLLMGIGTIVVVCGIRTAQGW